MVQEKYPPNQPWKDRCSYDSFTAAKRLGELWTEIRWINPSFHTKLLGVETDQLLSFQNHISVIVRKCYATLGGLSLSLSKMTRKLPQCIKKMIVEMLVFPNIVYCMTVWSGCGQTRRHRIQKVLNHSAQIVTGSCRSAHASPLLQKLGWPRLVDLSIESDLAMVHKILQNCHAPKCLQDIFCYRYSIWYH